MSELPSPTYSILLVEDNPADAELVRERLKDASGMSPFHITRASTLKEALTILHSTPFDVILLDLNLPETNGLETLKRIRSANSAIPLVVLTVHEDEPLALEAIKLGAQDYLPKSSMNAVLLSRILHYAMERERNERIRRESERKYRLFVDGATGLAFIMLDLLGNITHWNSGAERLFGYPEDAALHKHFSMLFTAEDQRNGRPATELRRAETLEKGDDDNWLVRADGSRFWASGAVTAIRDPDDNLIGFAKVVRDKSDQKDTSDKLAELNRTLEERVIQRTQELTRNQERLRAMASDLTVTEQRERRRLATDLHDYLAQLLVVCRLKLSQGQSMSDKETLLKVIQEADTLLDQSLTYTRTLVSQLSPTCLYEFGLHAALVWLGTEMGKQGLTVKLKCADETPPLPEDQAVLVFQSVRELLYNVLKHSGVKEVIVNLSLQQDNHLLIEVKDSGCGFSENPEERNEQSPTNFGLFSIRERLEALGGEMVLNSAQKMGTQVLLRIPIDHSSKDVQLRAAKPTPMNAVKHASVSRPPSEKIRILLADDHKMVREGFCHILNAQVDFEVVGEAEDGNHALALCESLRPDVVVMDLHMPKMDGLEAIKRIKEFLPDTVMIGLSVYDTPDVARWFREAGAAAFVTKGGPAESLVTIVRQYCQQKNPA
ncbi:response regulator [Candidatus Nitrospira allomarina]|uniref:Response regulator n=1 Tax=Candidatus Nitrospira allomarina TaxID=3020900 RepID=A0AA96GCU7_9BACT|nr:response regulator [Candidatus Nitrospira allomarina]WNM56673.1 response regulator [Candidatus Nitrospira allomarina]